MKLKDLTDQPLDNWQFRILYSAARLHNLVGYFPLIEKAEQKIVMCTDLNVLETIWSSIKPKFVYVQSGIFLVNQSENIVISLNQDQSDIDSNMFCLVQGVLHHNFINGSFGYPSGLLLTRDESKSVFPKTVQE